MPPLQITRMCEILPSQKKKRRAKKSLTSPKTHIVTEKVFRGKLDAILKTKATPPGPVLRAAFVLKDEAGD